MAEVKLGDALASLRIGELQSVGLMQIIPLLAPISSKREEEDRFLDPRDALVGTINYGYMTVKNPSSDSILIIPMNAAYMTKKRAQDHATTRAEVVPPSVGEDEDDSVVIDSSLCIESLQGGLIPIDRYDLSILPASLRAKTRGFVSSGQVVYGSLWDDIEKFCGVTRASERAHLSDFFKVYEKELDEFVAEFEIVPDMVGAIVLIGGEVVGVEYTPTPYYWKGVWEALIRGCYGSRAIEARKRLEQRKIPLPDFRVRLSERVESVKDLDRAVLFAELAERDLAADVANDLSKVAVSEIRTFGERKIHEYLFRSALFANSDLFGQIITENDEVIYLSLVKARVS